VVFGQSLHPEKRTPTRFQDPVIDAIEELAQVDTHRDAVTQVLDAIKRFTSEVDVAAWWTELPIGRNCVY
jgi:hypothetical protein